MTFFKRTPLTCEVIILIAAILLLFYASTVAANSSETDRTLILGIFPRQNAQTSYQLFNPLKKYLSTELGRKVVLDVSSDFPSFWLKLRNREFDLIYCNQYHYLAAHKDFNFEVIGTSVEFGKTTIAGTILVRQDSEFRSVADLKGKKILFGGDSHSMQSYIIATHLLRQAGLMAEDYQEAFAINPANAVLALYYQQVDAIGSGDLGLRLPAITKRIDTTELRFLAKGKQLPQLPWAVSSSLPPQLRSQIRKTLTTMHQSASGLTALQAASLDKIIPAQDKDFEPFRKIIMEIKGEQY